MAPTAQVKKTSDKNLFLRGDIYYFRKQVKGSKQRITISTGCKDKNQARRRKVELEKEANDETFGWRKKAVAPGCLDWLDTALRVHGVTMKGRVFEQTVKLAKRCWAADENDMPQRIDQLTTEHCATFRNWLTFQKFSQNSVRNRCGIMRLMWNHAARAGHVETNPWRGLKLPKEKPRRRILEQHEQAAFYSRLAPIWLRATQFLILTGLRHSEFLDLIDADILFDRAQIRVQHGKGDKARYVPLVPEAADIIKVQMRARDAGTMGVRVGARAAARIAEGRIWPFQIGTFLRFLTEASTEAALPAPTITVHDLRRTYGTRCAMSGVPMAKLKEWMGHASITITEKFYIVNNTRDDVALMASLRASAMPTGEAETGVVTKVVTVAGQ